MTVSKRLRYEVLRRDNHTCRYCGATAPDAAITVDHVVPVALGGTDEPSNLVAACRDCNAGKSSSNPDQPLVDDVSDDALRWAGAIANAASVMLASRENAAELRQPFLDAWNSWTYLDHKTGQRKTLDLPPGWEKSVDSILAAGLPMEILIECVGVAMASKKARDEFRYMCGCAWNRVAELREIAAAVAVVPRGRHHRSLDGE